MDVAKLRRNVKILSEALARQIYNISTAHGDIEIFTDSMVC